MFGSSDPFLMLAEERLRDLHEDARRAARVQEATDRRPAPRGRRRFGIAGWIGRALASRSASIRLRAAAFGRGAAADSDRLTAERRGRRPAA